LKPAVATGGMDCEIVVLGATELADEVSMVWALLRAAERRATPAKSVLETILTECGEELC